VCATEHAHAHAPHSQHGEAVAAGELVDGSPAPSSSRSSSSSSSRARAPAPALQPAAEGQRALWCADSVAARGGLVPHLLVVKVDGSRGPLGDVAVSGELSRREAGLRPSIWVRASRSWDEHGL